MVNRRYKQRTTNNERRTKRASALILAVVLTSLLALIGTMFLMAARVDSIGTSGISQNRDLDSAVEAVVANISQELSQDVPGMPKGSEYYDYPGDSDRWLASLEPYDNGTKWRQISDVTGYIGRVWRLSAQRDVDAEIVDEREKILLDYDGDIRDTASGGGQLADADGDGVADSKWIELEGMTSSKGQTIYAAIRVVDNGGMLNVNTAYQFDPSGTPPENRIDGSSLTQINLFALSKRSSFNTIGQLDDERYNSEPQNLDNYIRDVVWRYYPPAQGTKYTPFDISDELELRNRFTLNRSDVDSRIEEVWNSAFHALNYLRTPVDSSMLSAWEDEVYYEPSDINDVNTYSYRHIGTTYNMDRIINPAGEKMLSVNDPNVAVGSLYRAIKRAIGPGDPNSEDAVAQIAVDLLDWRDNDSNVSYYDVNGVTYYGFERPCVYISELAHHFVDPNLPTAPMTWVYRSYAIELHKPYSEDNDPCQNKWRLFIDNSGSVSGASDVNVSIDWLGTRRFHVIYFMHSDSSSPALLNVSFDPNDIDPNRSPDAYTRSINTGRIIFEDGSVIRLQRLAGNGNWITVDQTYPPQPGSGWLQIGTGRQSIQRDITLHKCIRRLWANATQVAAPTLGRANTYTGSPGMIQAHPANKNFTNVGEITRLFRKGAYGFDGIGYSSDSDEEHEVRFNLADPNMREVFKYLTRFDPANDDIDNDGDGQTDETTLTQTPEFKVAGRININTAPWYVIAQLPWMTHDIAQKIVEYRDTAAVKGFENIGELMQVAEMHYYKTVEPGDLAVFPDLTPGDGAPDDFEERDVIFARVSDLVTVRSDVFTAYILVRIGTDGPQRRALAILDRSNVYAEPSGGVIGRVKVAALHPVPDPR